MPKGVWFQRKVASGQAVRYGYFGWRPGTRALGREGTAVFFNQLARAMRRAEAKAELDRLDER